MYIVYNNICIMYIVYVSDYGLFYVSPEESRDSGNNKTGS